MDYIIHLAILVLIYAVLGLSLNLVVGYTGLLASGHAAFYGIGAYATAILTTSLGLNFFVSMALGVVVTGAAAFLIGIVLSRFDGDYYALVSLGFNVIIYSIFLNWQGLTRGPLGIPGIPKPVLFGADFSSGGSFLALAAVFVAVAYLACRFIVRSSFGRVLKAIREDEKAVQVFGYNTLYYKLAVFILSAGMAAAAGSLIASYITFIDPSSFTVMESVFVLAIIIFGGLSSLRGSIIGALSLVLLPELLRFAGFPQGVAAQMRQAVYGLFLIFLMLYRPQGLFGEFKL
ncbi:MAG: branched-chain amino acid ABC transporter permease [Deltaproteobacteria bacterium]|nr:branched-chain amino acid ABC transporter permease [Deltaproteobacteria bacterium]